MTARDDFAAALEELATLRQRHHDEREALNTECVAAIIEAARPAYEAKLAKLSKARRAKLKLDYYAATLTLGDEETERLMKPFHERASATGDRQHDEEKALKAKLDTLAETAEIHPGEFWHGFEESWVSTYSTQGWGAESYARNAMKVAALVPMHFNIETEVVKNPGSSEFTSGYVVAVKVESMLDVEIMKRKPAISFRDWMKACWKTGANPRVFNPWLPHGLEEKLGIDYHGNDIARSNT